MFNPESETAWDRAKRDTAAVYRSAYFGIASAIVSILAAAVAGLITDGSQLTGGSRVLVVVVVALSSLAVLLIGVFFAEIATAPVRQRNELRRAWPRETDSAPDIELALRNYARQGDDLRDRMDTGPEFTKNDGARAETWADDVSTFLSVHVPLQAATFIDAAEGVPGAASRLRARRDVLQNIIRHVESSP